jgi:hypothetical protein
MRKYVWLVFPPASLGHKSKANSKTMRGARLCVMLTGFLTTLKHHEREALAYLAASLTTPIQSVKLLITPLVDTF